MLFPAAGRQLLLLCLTAYKVLYVCVYVDYFYEVISLVYQHYYYLFSYSNTFTSIFCIICLVLMFVNLLCQSFVTCLYFVALTK